MSCTGIYNTLDVSGKICKKSGYIIQVHTVSTSIGLVSSHLSGEGIRKSFLQRQK